MDLISEEFLKNNKVLCLSSQKPFNQLQQQLVVTLLLQQLQVQPMTIRLIHPRV